MSPNIGAISNSYRRGWDAIFDFAVHLSETIKERINIADPLSLYQKVTSSDVENITQLEDIDREEKRYETLFAETDKDLQPEREKLKDSMNDLAGDFDPASKAKEALMSVWAKVIKDSNTIKALQKTGRKVYESVIQWILPFDFGSESSTLEFTDEKELFSNNYLVKMVDEKIRESMRKRVRKAIL